MPRVDGFGRIPHGRKQNQAVRFIDGLIEIVPGFGFVESTESSLLPRSG
jgi:hypothetical protein